MSDGPVWVQAEAEVGTHHAFVNLLARVTWAMKDVALYRLWVVSTPAGVRLELEGNVGAAVEAAIRQALADAGLKLRDVPA